VSKRAGQPVDLVDHNDIDPARPHLGKQRLQGRAVERGSRQAAINRACHAPACDTADSSNSFLHISETDCMAEDAVNVEPVSG
jgi:hypothetical protein